MPASRHHVRMVAGNRSDNNARHVRTRLTGWKEIASFFGKAVRTVQRWEKEVGLPVHRINTGGGETVYAFVEELEQWQASARGREAAREASEAGGSVLESATAATAAAPDPPAASPQAGARPSVVPWVIAGVIVAAAVIAFIGYLWIGGSTEKRQPAQWRVDGNRLVIADGSGRFLWDYRFDRALNAAAYDTPWTRHEDHPAVVFHDIDGDDWEEVLFVHEPWRATSRGLFCFSHDGALRFHYEPQHAVRFGDKSYHAPWRAVAVYAIGQAGRPHDLWFVSAHLEEFPTVLEKLDINGNPKSAYWSNGQISSVVQWEVGGRPLLFVGAISNEFRGGSLAVLDAARPSGAAPAASDHYRCTGCPPGAPVAFLVFPRLDVTVAVDGYSRVVSTFTDRTGQILVNLLHDVANSVPQELQDAATSHYILDSQFRVVAAELGTRYASVHAEFERRGLLHHPFDARSAAKELWPIRRWDGSRFQEVTGLDAAPGR